MLRRKIALVMALAVSASLMIAGTALAKDRNHDRIPDRWEKAHHLSLKVKQARRDQDGDGLKNRGEWRAKLDPRDDDTDNDGIEDGDEDAGTVASFTGDVLTINLARGGTLSGKVTDETDIECDSEPGDDHGEDEGDGEHGDGNNGAEDDGDDEHGDDGGGDDRAQAADDDGDDVGNEDCGTEALVAQTKVLEAELKVIGGEAVWTDVELAKP